MKTPLTELIDWIENEIRNDGAIDTEATYLKAKELLPKEKEVIINAWLDGGKMIGEAKNATQYFQQTFNTEE